MSVSPESYRCDGCGQARVNDANHWLSMVTIKTGVKFVMGIQKNAPHYCGLACATKGFQGWFYGLVNANKPELSEQDDVR